MYTDFYRLSGRPFQLSPNRRFFYPGRGHRRAMAQLTQGLEQAEGVIVLTGATGTGKTLLVDYLLAQLPSQRFLAARLDGGRVAPEEVLPLVGKALGVVAAGGRIVWQGAISAVLRRTQATNRRALLVVDEIQTWPEASLEELRLLADLHHDGRAVMQILLAGQVSFLELLARPEHAQLRQRVIASARLEPLAADEVGPYVEHRLARVGWRQDPRFMPDALGVIFEQSQGIPRRINLLCSRILVLAAIDQRHEIDAAAVLDAATELEQDSAGPAVPGAPAAAIPGVGPTGPGAPAAAIPGTGPGAVEPERAERAPPSVEAGAELPADLARWWAEVGQLQHQLERALGDLSDERQKGAELRAEAERLRAELHRIELERLRVEAETARRAVHALARDARPADARLFRRFAAEDLGPDDER